MKSTMARRILAAILELILLPLLAYSFIEFLPGISADPKLAFWQGAYFVFVLVFWILSIIYILFKDAFWNGQSLAKKLFRLRVVSFKTRVKCRWWQSLVRNLLFFVPFSMLIELIVAYMNPGRRRIGDFLAGTIVIEAHHEYLPKPKPKNRFLEYFLKTIVTMVAAILIAGLFYLAYRYVNEKSVSEKIRSSYDPVVTLVTYDRNNRFIGYGSAFFVNSEGYAVTSRHVLYGAGRAVVIFRQKEFLPVESVVDEDSFRDVAIIKIKAKNTPFLRLSNSDAVEIGNEIYSIGTPLGLPSTVSKGIVSQIRDIAGLKIFQIDASISLGSSGGPLLDSKFKTIGIVTAYVREGQNLNFAIPINYARTLLDKDKVKYSR
jgi:uncharacterized RDD family membrane protein YckC